MKFRFAVSLCMLMALLACEKVGHWPWEKQTVTLHSGALDVQTPAVIQTHQGNWMAVFTSKTDSPDVEGLVLLTRAERLNGPWSEPDTVVRTANLCRYPKISQLKNGMVWLQVEIGRLGESNVWIPQGTVCTESYNHGRNFSVPRIIRIPGDIPWHAVSGMLEMDDRWLIPVLYEEAESVKKPGVVFSVDLGATWSGILPILPDETKLAIRDFCITATQKQGVTVMMEQTDSEQLVMDFSRNRGMDWDSPKWTNVYGTHPEIHRSQTGTIYCIYQDDWPSGISMMRSYDFGHTFEQEKRLDLPEKSSFPEVLELGTNQLVLFYTEKTGLFAQIYTVDTAGIPGGLSASADSTSVILRWNPAGKPVYYRIYRKVGTDSSDAEQPYDVSITPTYMDTLVSPNSVYSYRISAVQGIGKLFAGSGSETSLSDPVEVVFP